MDNAEISYFMSTHVPDQEGNCRYVLCGQLWPCFTKRAVDNIAYGRFDMTEGYTPNGERVG